MNQIISWICLICICFLCLQVMIYLCEDIIKVFNAAKVNNKSKKKKSAIATYSYSYEKKIAK